MFSSLILLEFNVCGIREGTQCFSDGQLAVPKLLNNSLFFYTIKINFIMDSKKKKSPCNLGCFCQYLSISLSVSCCFGYCGFIGHFVIWWGKSPLSASYSFLPSEFLGSAHMFSLPEEFKNQLVKFQNLPTEILMEIALN